MNALFRKLDEALTGICLYGIAPPKLETSAEQVAQIAAQQVARLRELGADGLVVYDIQDEPGPAGAARPFPFLPTLQPERYACSDLADLAIPKIVYRCVGANSREAFGAWLETVRAGTERRLSVFVGAPRGGVGRADFKLPEAYALARGVPNLTFGGICIAERHESKGNEHERMLAKQADGCRFFITQSVYNAGSTKSLLSDYALSLRARAQNAVPLILTFSPCGSVRTLEFMKWLGISFPRWLENELRHSPDTLSRSIDLCESVFLEIQAYAREKQLPIGINVESVSIRKAEIEASVELYRRLCTHLDQ